MRNHFEEVVSESIRRSLKCGVPTKDRMPCVMMSDDKVWDPRAEVYHCLPKGVKLQFLGYVQRGCD